MKKILYVLFLLALSSNAMAQQTIGTIVDNFFSQGHLAAIAKIIEGIAYLVAIGLGIKGILKLNEWNESKGKNVKLSTSITYIICSGLMFGLPSVIKVGSESFLGTSATPSFNCSSGQYGGQY